VIVRGLHLKTVQSAFHTVALVAGERRMNDKSQAQEVLQNYCERNECIANVLSDFELSPTARMVGASLGLAVDLDRLRLNASTNPQIGQSTFVVMNGYLRERATLLGLPVAIVFKSCDALIRRRRLRLFVDCDGQRGFVLTRGARRRPA
jgi:hypothetical protein